MRGIVAHGVLLAVALVLAFVTWTSKEAPDTGQATISVWDHAPADIAAVSFHSSGRTLQLERRANGARSYLWAQQTTRPVPPPHVADSTGELAEQADTVVLTTETGEAGEIGDSIAPEPERMEEFPVGKEGDTLVEQLARLRALRDLGDATQEKRDAYGLADTTSTISVEFRDGTERTLGLGNSVVGGGNRYVLDVERNRVFVLPVGVIQPLESGEMLRLTEYQSFEPDDVARVTVRAGTTAERSMRRHTTGSPEAAWSPADSDRPDPAFGSFMQQIDQLWVSRYASDVSTDTLNAVLRVEYHNARGSTIGSLELFRGRDAGGTPAYFMQTGRTIVPGEIYAPLGERLEQDVESLFRAGGSATASAPAARVPSSSSASRTST